LGSIESLGGVSMTLKEELIQAIQHFPDDIVRDLLVLLQALQQQSAPVDEGLLAEQLTVLERMGGVPKHLLAVGNLSDRDQRRALITAHLQKKYRPDVLLTNDATPVRY
jgi:hypothetical protein